MLALEALLFRPWIRCRIFSLLATLVPDSDLVKGGIVTALVAHVYLVIMSGLRRCNNGFQKVALGSRHPKIASRSVVLFRIDNKTEEWEKEDERMRKRVPL